MFERVVLERNFVTASCVRASFIEASFVRASCVTASNCRGTEVRGGKGSVSDSNLQHIGRKCVDTFFLSVFTFREKHTASVFHFLCGRAKDKIYLKKIVKGSRAYLAG